MVVKAMNYLVRIVTMFPTAFTRKCILLLSVTAFMLYCLRGEYVLLTIDTGSILDDETIPNDFSSTSQVLISTKTKTKTLGRQIVENAFQESYGYLVDFCGELNQRFSLQTCFARLHSLRSDVNSTAPIKKFPWWLQTMIRDARLPKSGINGPWHYLQFTADDPKAMQLCVYEKGGTKTWRILHCKLMKKLGVNITGTTATTCYSRQGKWLEEESIPKSVFLRDPLERYLSGFLDKCVDPNNRRTTPHCRPNILFQNEDDIDAHVTTFLEDSQTLFQLHMDVSPMDWDLHFFPISFMCGGLYQKIKDYTFVGKMDDTFYQELGRFIQLYPDLKDAVEEGFKMKGKEEEQNVGTEKKAALLAQGYFTPNTVRKALQYYSIDYMLLGLEIPQWAEEILERDETYLL